MLGIPEKMLGISKLFSNDKTFELLYYWFFIEMKYHAQ